MIFPAASSLPRTHIARNASAVLEYLARHGAGGLADTAPPKADRKQRGLEQGRAGTTRVPRVVPVMHRRTATRYLRPAHHTTNGMDVAVLPTWTQGPAAAPERQSAPRLA
ncbi:hypothetical protein [Streptomyces sp. NEAU-W12]|uniref:hypothetical protein n=1 Tax=Streptomyces sp. NEAU-W12 TaxID=2994668 RepID=UPI00224A5423|nr:hypothetical protein [Streptomyces sp. NEAU-W12]MCX2923461.1 hypothetical protein [Streptomyces sp. NEAU-W12]